METKVWRYEHRIADVHRLGKQANSLAIDLIGGGDVVAPLLRLAEGFHSGSASSSDVSPTEPSAARLMLKARVMLAINDQTGSSHVVGRG